MSPALARRSILRLFAAMAALATRPAAAADDMPVFRIVMTDGVINPTRLTVPADRPFKLEISNEGKTPAEFESASLHKEKVLAAGVTSALVFRRLEAGEYDFFDDFHPEARATLVVK